MTKMLELVAQMNARLSETARTEEALIDALGIALREADSRLLAEVRDLTLAHEARRVAILGELQTLAARIGAFPAIADESGALSQEPSADSLIGADEDLGLSPGDWRRAVNNIKDELDVHYGRPRAPN